jgi:hypothetical protein
MDQPTQELHLRRSTSACWRRRSPRAIGAAKRTIEMSVRDSRVPVDSASEAIAPRTSQPADGSDAPRSPRPEWIHAIVSVASGWNVRQVVLRTGSSGVAAERSPHLLVEPEVRTRRGNLSVSVWFGAYSGAVRLGRATVARAGDEHDTKSVHEDRTQSSNEG